MANADYTVQDKVRSENPAFAVPKVATIVGTGGFGAWVAVFLAKAGVSRLVLINPTGIGPRTGSSDDIEGREIAVGPYNDDQLGMAKVDALEDVIRPMRPDIEIEKHKLLFKPEEHGDLLEGTVFAGVSHIETLHGIFQVAAKAGLKCYTGVYLANSAGTFTKLPSSFTRIAGNDAPAWVGTTAMSALLAVNSAIVGDINFYADISSLEGGQGRNGVKFYPGSNTGSC